MKLKIMKLLQALNLSVEELIELVSKAISEEVKIAVLAAINAKAEIVPINDYLSKKEFANRIGKSTSFVDQERRAGRLKWRMNGGTVAIPSSEIGKYA